MPRPLALRPAPTPPPYVSLVAPPSWYLVSLGSWVLLTAVRCPAAVAPLSLRCVVLAARPLCPVARSSYSNLVCVDTFPALPTGMPS
jgi:hypothetical protein